MVEACGTPPHVGRPYCAPRPWGRITEASRQTSGRRLWRLVAFFHKDNRLSRIRPVAYLPSAGCYPVDSAAVELRVEAVLPELAGSAELERQVPSADDGNA